MKPKPDYFEDIRALAAGEWAQLEANPRLAGPWHQMFKQVQSPRQVVSELLQNADDAGATEASVRINGDWFEFSHNGRDFARDEFESICGFGHSNKRVLHTIGFRGIGFKSTFSLGDVVELTTPTLSVAFRSERFTEPLWRSEGHSSERTEVRVAIKDGERRTEVEGSLEEWLRSPVSLLFFEHIRRLRIGEHDLHWQTLSQGPAAGTTWVALRDKPEQQLLLASSEDLPLPEGALDELKQERLLREDERGDFPPCKVQLVLGAQGVLYAVLPTGVKTALPFACNAPFIQDPARSRIKDPETSVTNRWLLHRLGALAAQVLHQWLSNVEVESRERVAAYALLPSIAASDVSLEGVAARLVSDGIDADIEELPVVLTDEGELAVSGTTVFIPPELLDVWPNARATEFIDTQNRPAISRYISPQHRKALVERRLTSDKSRADVLDALEKGRPAKPENWQQLATLWSYVSHGLSRSRTPGRERKLNIVPVRGADELYPASEVVRLGSKRVIETDADWQFLTKSLHVLDAAWLRFLTAERRRANDSARSEGGEGESDLNDVESALSVLKAVGLEEASNPTAIIERVSSTVFAESTVPVRTCVQLTQIAAKIGATVGPSFQYVTRDLKRRPSGNSILFDADGSLEPLLPDAWRAERLIHEAYTAEFNSCSPEEWSAWIGSRRSGVGLFPRLESRTNNYWTRASFEQELQRRGLKPPTYYPYVRDRFTVNDWDFPDALVSHWDSLTARDSPPWGLVVEMIVREGSPYWKPAAEAKAKQIATTGNEE